MRVKSRQIACIALLPFVLAASVASLDALVLCTADGHGVAVELAHPARGACGSREAGGFSQSHGSHDSHGCGHSDGPQDKIGHDHVTCSDIPLRLNQGDVQDRRPAVTLQAESFVMEDVEQLSSESTVCLPGHHSSLQHLKSVVLQV